MSIELIKTLFMVLGPACLAWAVWVTMSHMKAKAELDAIKLYVAENYAKNDTLKDIDKKLDAISGMVHVLSGRLGVSLPKE